MTCASPPRPSSRRTAEASVSSQPLLADLDPSPRVIAVLRQLDEEDRVGRRLRAGDGAAVPRLREVVFLKLAVAVGDQAVRLGVARIDAQRPVRGVDAVLPAPLAKVALGEEERGEVRRRDEPQLPPPKFGA